MYTSSRSIHSWNFLLLFFFFLLILTSYDYDYEWMERDGEDAVHKRGTCMMQNYWLWMNENIDGINCNLLDGCGSRQWSNKFWMEINLLESMHEHSLGSHRKITASETFKFYFWKFNHLGKCLRKKIPIFNLIFFLN